MPFLELGLTDGVLPSYIQDSDNRSSEAINIPGRFALGITSQATVYVRNV